MLQAASTAWDALSSPATYVSAGVGAVASLLLVWVIRRYSTFWAKIRERKEERKLRDHAYVRRRVLELRADPHHRLIELVRAGILYQKSSSTSLMAGAASLSAAVLVARALLANRWGAVFWWVATALVAVFAFLLWMVGSGLHKEALQVENIVEEAGHEEERNWKAPDPP